MFRLLSTIFLSLIAGSAVTFSAEPEEVVQIKLAEDTVGGLAAQRGKPVEHSASRASKFRLGPGFTNATMVSLELVGAKDHYLRHRGSVARAEEKPKLSAVFDADATWKMVPVEGGKVRFETSNYPGMFLTVREDGAVITARAAEASRSTFVLKKE